MPLNPVRRKFFEEALGVEGANTLEAQLASLGMKATAAGVAFKDLFVGIDLDAVPDAPAAGTKETVVDTPDTATAPVAAVAVPAAELPTDQTSTVVPADALPTAADAATGAPLPPSLEASAKAVMEQSFKDMLSGAIGEALTPLVTQIATLDAQVKELAGSKDAAIAAAIRPAVGPIGAVPASLSADSAVTDPAKIAAIKEASTVLDNSPIAKHFKALTAAAQTFGD